MCRLLAPALLALVLGGTLLALEDRQATDGERIARLVADLGSRDFATRESAQIELDTIGEPALGPLNSACRSASPEVSRRARDLVARIERRIDNERTLAPTLVELKAEKLPLGDVLADLSKQSGYLVSVRRSPAGDDAEVPVTVQTSKVPFWEAVVQLCDAADLRIASVSGYVSPTTNMAGATSPRPQPLPSIGRSGRRTRGAVEITSSPNIVLERRGKEPKRPTAVFGGVLVEAFPVPTSAATPDAEAALLQVWPEPKLNWQEVKGLRVERAMNPLGKLLDPVIPEVDPPPQRVVQGNGVIMIQQANGGVVLVNQRAGGPVPASLNFMQSARQVVARFKTDATPSETLKRLTGAVHGTVRSKREPLVELKRMKRGQTAEGSHPAGVEMQATLTQNAEGKWQASIELTYDQTSIMPSDEGSRGVGSSAMGIRIADANGNGFGLIMTRSHTTVRGVGINRARNQIIRGFTFALTPPQGKSVAPETVSFWGTFPKPVEVPFSLEAVPLACSR